MNIVIPMAGAARRFSEAGYSVPKPFLPLGEKTMIEQIIDNVAGAEDTVILIYRLEHWSYVKELTIKFPHIRCVPVREITEGAACTVLLAERLIDNGQPLLIANSDQWVEYDRREWERYLRSVDGGMMVFESREPKWSYALCDPDTGRVMRVAEKQVISDCATVGIYYFAKGRDFVRAAKQMIAKDIRVNGEFYVCPAFNELVDSHEIQPFWVSRMYGLGTPEDYERNKPLVEELL